MEESNTRHRTKDATPNTRSRIHRTLLTEQRARTRSVLARRRASLADGSFRMREFQQVMSLDAVDAGSNSRASQRDTVMNLPNSQEGIRPLRGCRDIMGKYICILVHQEARWQHKKQNISHLGQMIILYVDNLVPRLLSWEIVQDLHSTDITREACTA